MGGEEVSMESQTHPLWVWSHDCHITRGWGLSSRQGGGQSPSETPIALASDDSMYPWQPGLQ